MLVHGVASDHHRRRTGPSEKAAKKKGKKDQEVDVKSGYITGNGYILRYF